MKQKSTKTNEDLKWKILIYPQDHKDQSEIIKSAEHKVQSSVMTD